MFYTHDDFIENQQQDQQRLIETGHLMHLNASQTVSIKERLSYTTNKLLQQQQRLNAQRQALFRLQQRLEQQYDRLFEFSQYIARQ